MALSQSALLELLEAMVQETESAYALRQATPFAGALDPRERWRLWRAVKDRLAAP